MAEKRKIIDPDGDLLVILREPSTISSWSVEADPVSLEPVGPETSDVITEPNNNEEAQPELSEAPDPEEWHFKASSKHLALASTHFKKMMDGPWREAHEIHDDGLRHWVLDDFDPDALAIVLNIIHGKSRRVPRIVQLEALVEIARIVDYVECHEAVEVYSSPWIRQLEDTVPSSYAWYTTELAYWICIAGVFYEDKIFESCTRLAILESYIDIPTLGLPILPSVGGEQINYLRRSNLSV
jgi:hypothetical protein